ncbi:MAG: RagB/SusD family nutrient uptake outer membrane protein [Bacteroidales bacterium]|jgi:hypothetical protein|nr:RagB/SusD family nutrient uptake outer membrane protein [Bacteroidales bacterium]
MKKYKFIIIVWMGVSALMLSSCNDNFLERAPLVNLSDADFWKSENDLKIYCNNFYNHNGLLPTYRSWDAGPFGVDGYNGSDTQPTVNYNRRMNGENTLPSSGGGWSSGDWSLLRDINYFMDHYSLVEASADKINPYAGEALFFRAVFYYNKLRTFGDVPWIATTVGIDSELLTAPRISRDQVVENMMQDLDKAVEYLPARAGGSYTGRITKETALALQARIALYEGTWEKYHALKDTPFKVNGSDGTKFIRKAADAAGALIALAEANSFPALDHEGVENGYWKLFNQYDYSNYKGVLFWRRYSKADGIQQNWMDRLGLRGGGFGLSKRMVESYLCMDGKPIAVSSLYQGDGNLKSVVANRDPRLNQTLFVDDGEHVLWEDTKEYFTVPLFDGASSDIICSTGYQLWKGTSPNYADYYGTWTSYHGAILFRYAEVLLIYAEAKAELGEITQSDIDKTVNALRKRVGMTGMLDINNITTDPNWEFAGLSPALQEIRRERKVELVSEGFRVDDIFRWAAADELIAGKRPLGAVLKQWENYPGATESFLGAVAMKPVNAEGYIDPYRDFSALANGYQFNLGRDYLSPIPTNELVLNPQLAQNPGW